MNRKLANASSLGTKQSMMDATLGERRKAGFAVFSGNIPINRAGILFKNNRCNRCDHLNISATYQHKNGNDKKLPPLRFLKKQLCYYKPEISALNWLMQNYPVLRTIF
ncbi:MAG: hypothetical protein ACXW1W_07290 [Methylococcaceae bacterium]